MKFKSSVFPVTTKDQLKADFFHFIKVKAKVKVQVVLNNIIVNIIISQLKCIKQVKTIDKT